eukprot:TRINITY_DN5963_c0_g2_i1.p1 TRINITY_DN5963_c0_g2~~TRINITY_DN5963_c0_g2_i1.p1  ORF type:complete len:124 (+),score=38.96 TRINITY_DN5963_c0_g2_i1:54-425(+)
MTSQTLQKMKKKKRQAEELKATGEAPKKYTEATRGHMVAGKLERMRHGLKRKRKYRIGTATAHDIYEHFDKPLPDVKCDAAKEALRAAAQRKAAAAPAKEAPKVSGGVVKKRVVVVKKKKAAA